MPRYNFMQGLEDPYGLMSGQNYAPTQQSYGGATFGSQYDPPSASPWMTDFGVSPYSTPARQNWATPSAYSPMEDLYNPTPGVDAFDPSYAPVRNDPWKDIFNAPQITQPTQKPYDPQLGLTPLPVKRRNDPFSGIDFGTSPEVATQETTPTTSAPYMEPPQEREPYQMSDYPMMQRYTELAGQMPQRGEYGGKMNKFMAALVGGGIGLSKGAGAGIAAGTQVSNAPYMNAVEDWKAQLEPAEKAATMERYQKQNERMYTDINRKREAAEASIKFRDEDSRRKYAANLEVARMNNLELVPNKATGEVFMVDPTNPNVPPKNLGKLVMSSEELITEKGGIAGAESNARQANEMEKLRTRIAADIRLEGMNQGGQNYRQQQQFGENVLGRQFVAGENEKLQSQLNARQGKELEVRQIMAKDQREWSSQEREVIQAEINARQTSMQKWRSGENEEERDWKASQALLKMAYDWQKYITPNINRSGGARVKTDEAIEMAIMEQPNAKKFFNEDGSLNATEANANQAEFDAFKRLVDLAQASGRIPMATKPTAPTGATR